jgi:hypothetical protein
LAETRIGTWRIALRSGLFTAAAVAAMLVMAAPALGADRVYWANVLGNPISFANLDGSGGGNLTTTGATANEPWGAVVDPTTERIYWANNASNTIPISYANLDGSGGGNLNTTGATASTPVGVAIDPTTGRIYWANNDSNSTPISYADLDGSGGGNLPVTGATPDGAFGVAIDPTAGRVYWANEHSDSNPISYANLDGSGGGNLATTGATADIPGFPVLLEAPRGTAAPIVSGESTAGSQLSCSQGTWAPDLPASFLYRAPQSFTYSWTLNGGPISGATSSSITASSAGQYACRVTATNFAGSTAQSSPAFTVSAAPVPPPTTTTTTATIGNQRIILTTPVACIAPPGKLAATATSTKPATGTKLRFSNLAFYVGKGIKRSTLGTRSAARRRSPLSLTRRTRSCTMSPPRSSSPSPALKPRQTP